MMPSEALIISTSNRTSDACGNPLCGTSAPLTVQSERKPSKTTEVMAGMLAFCMAEKAAVLATAGLDPGPAAAEVS